MQVVILAGGLGTRLRPFLEYQIDWVKQFGFDRVLLLTGYHGEQTASFSLCLLERNHRQTTGLYNRSC
jgi:NDP-sugar pyrophosphorylase family protein